MAIIDVLTAYGASVLNPPNIDGVQIGTGHVTTEALARARTTLVTPRGSRQMVDGRVSGNQIQAIYRDITQDAFTINEIGLFVGNNLYAYRCDDAGAAIGSKVADRPLNFTWQLTKAEGQTVDVSTAIVPLPPALEEALGAVMFPDSVDVTDTDPYVLSPAQVVSLISSMSGQTLTDDQVKRIVSEMVTGNTETGISVTATGTPPRFNFVVSSAYIQGVINQAYIRARVPASYINANLDSNVRRIVTTTGTTRPAGVNNGDFWATREA